MTASIVNGRRRQAAVGFILVTALIDVLSFGVLIPVLPHLIEHFTGGDTARAARLYGLIGTVWALMQFLCSPLLGALSDRLGRRPVILISCFGLGIDFIVMALAPTLWWLLIGRIVSGITAASFSTANAYIADVTPPEKRAAAFGMVGAAWGLGFVIGPALGGFLAGIAPRLPFWFSAGLALSNALYGLLLLPESLPRERRAAFSWRKANPVGSIGLLRAHPGLLRLAIVYLLYWLAHYVLPSVCVLYTGYRYGWGPQTMGYVLAATGFCGIIVQALLVKRVVSRIGEARSATLGLLFGIAGYLGFGLAPHGWLFWCAVPVFALLGLFPPALQAMMSRSVSSSEQGRLQGANSSLMGISGIIGPGLYTQIFALFIEPDHRWTLPGAPFIVAAALAAIALLLTRGRRQPDRPVAVSLAADAS